MKTLLAPQSIVFFCLVGSFAIASEFKSHVITPISAPLTIIVPSGRFLTISNFTQEGASSPRGTVIVTFGTPTPTPTPTPAPTATPTPTTTPTPTATPTPTTTPTPTPTPSPQTVLTASFIDPGSPPEFIKPI